MITLKNQSLGVRFSMLLLLVLVIAGSSVRAERVGPGTYHGYFNIDRWGQQVLHQGPYHTFVADSAVPALKPHQGKPLEVEVSEILPSTFGGPGLITKLKDVSEKGMAGGLALSAKLESPKVVQGKGVTIRFTLSNHSEERIKLWPRRLAVVLVTDSPFSSESIEYEHPDDHAYWFYSYSYQRIESALAPEKGGKQLQVACHKVELPWEDKDLIFIEPKGKYEAEITVGKELLPDDYEVFVYLNESYKTPVAGPMSGRLSFDVVREQKGDKSADRSDAVQPSAAVLDGNLLADPASKNGIDGDDPGSLHSVPEKGDADSVEQPAFNRNGKSAGDRRNAQTEKMKAPRAKKELDAASREIMKFYAAQPNNGHREGAKLTVSEYQIGDLWEKMGIQLFRLDRGRLFSWNLLHVDGQLTRVKILTHGGAGLLRGAVHKKTLYLTSDWGSGIMRTALYQTQRNKDGKIQTKEVGVISSSPRGRFDRKFLEDEAVKEVMTLLRPLKRGKAVRVTP